MSIGIKPPGSREARGVSSARVGKKGGEPVAHRRVDETEDKQHPHDEDALSHERGANKRSLSAQDGQRKSGSPLAGAFERPQSSALGKQGRVVGAGVHQSANDPALRQLAQRVVNAFQQADPARQDAARSLFSALDR